MDLSTRYLGLVLPHPLMPGASPLAENLDTVRRLEDAGAAAIVLPSLFEEQLLQDRMSVLRHTEDPAEGFAEALSYFPHTDDFALGPESYLEQIRRIKLAVNVPVIASLNGITRAGWIDYARLIEQAGADALELNVYFVAAGAKDTAASVEDRLIEIAAAVKQSVELPVAVKLSPFFSALRHLVRRLEALEIDGLVLFNRFYQPDIDIEALETVPRLSLSTSSELLLRLRWLAILSGRVRPSLAASGGIHDTADAIKALMAGADAVQLVSALLQRGPSHLSRLRNELVEWLERHQYASLAEMQGSMNLLRCPDPAAFERANYMAALQGWGPENRPAADF
ncbi:MAG: dihydroorotate dehydrogenase-like protein [Azospirillum sp.]|nr:dihydroorotate dehydrogenase-like protein [Azospirillum sp.]